MTMGLCHDDLTTLPSCLTWVPGKSSIRKGRTISRDFTGSFYAGLSLAGLQYGHYTTERNGDAAALLSVLFNGAWRQTGADKNGFRKPLY